MGELGRLASLVFHIPTYGPSALGHALGLYDEKEPASFEDVEAKFPDLFGGN